MVQITFLFHLDIKGKSPLSRKAGPFDYCCSSTFVQYFWRYRYHNKWNISLFIKLPNMIIKQAARSEGSRLLYSREQGPKQIIKFVSFWSSFCKDFYSEGRWALAITGKHAQEGFKSQNWLLSLKFEQLSGKCVDEKLYDSINRRNTVKTKCGWKGLRLIFEGHKLSILGNKVI